MKTSISKIGLSEAIAMILPYMVTCGEVAKGIQKSLTGSQSTEPAQKGGDLFHSALTDADILVESYLGMQLFIMFDDVVFEGEEKDSDRISAYFPKEAEYMITLDPVNGTLFFKNGLPIFDIILTICRGSKMIAAINYIPCRGVFYIAIEGQGAFASTAEDVLTGREWKPFLLSVAPNSVLTQRASADMIQRLEATGFEVLEMTKYTGGSDWKYSCNSLLTGDVCGMVKNNASIIDWGAIGFIAACAGGAHNNPVYSPDTLRAPLMVVGTDPKIYKKIINAL